MFIKFLLFFSMSFNIVAMELNLSPLLKMLDPAFMEREQSAPMCADLGTEVLLPNDHGECLKEICGAPPEFKPVMEHVLGEVTLNGFGDLNFEEPDPIKDSMAEKIKQYFELKQSNPMLNISEQELRTMIEAELATLEQSGVGSDLGVFVRGALLLSEENDFEIFINEQAEIDAETLKITFNQEVYDSFESDSRMRKFVKKYEKWINREGLLALRIFDPREFIEVSYPKETFEDGMKLYFEKVKALQSKLIEFSPLFGNTDFNLALFSEKLAAGTLTETDLTFALNEGMKIENRAQLSKLMDGSHPELVEEKLSQMRRNFGQLTENGLISRLVDKVREEAIEVKLFYQDDISLKKILAEDSCLAAYELNQRSLPTQAQIDDLTKLTEKFKGEYLVSISQYSGFSTVSKPIIVSLLSDVRINMPFSKESWVEMVEENLDAHIASERSNNSNLDKEKIVEGLVRATLLANSVEEISAGSTYSRNVVGLITQQTDDPIKSLCEGLQQQPLSDSTLTATGVVLTSYTSALMPAEDAKYNLFHELSHNLEAILRNGVSANTNTGFQKNKDCINNLHSYLGEADTDGYYYKEDFADFMASELLPKNSHSGLCHFLGFDYRRNTFDINTFKTINTEDIHSNTAFRLLRFSVDNRNVLPESCVDALSSEGITSVSRTCSF